MPRHPVELAVMAMSAILVLVAGVPARAALNCPPPNATPMAPNDILGVVSRVETNPKIGRSIQYTVQPNLEDLDPAEWMRNIEKAGANIAQINLQPIAAMARTQTIDDSDWDAYIAAAFEPHERQGPEQRAAYKAMRDRIGARNGVAGITPEQQTKLLIAFLGRLEALKKDGLICGNVQFIVGERRWFPVGRSWDDKFDNETMYARTVGDFINTAKAAGLDHWLAGIFFPEHTNTDMNQLLPITVGITSRINGLTGNWLKSHLMVLAGGGFGNQFNGIDTVVCPQSDPRHQFSCQPGRPFDFFGLISEQTGTFALAYKACNWETAPTPRQYCAARAAKCDPRQMSVADWTDYLGSSTGGLGFADLAVFVNRNAAKWPRAANVMFVGNATDSLFRMVEVQPGALGDRLVATPQLIALASLFQDAARGGGGWSGHFFMDPYGDTDRQHDPDHMPMDNGSYLFFVNYSPYDFQGDAAIHANPQTQAFWRAWPKLPAQSP
jgi:hypothetical protein